MSALMGPPIEPGEVHEAFVRTSVELFRTLDALDEATRRGDRLRVDRDDWDRIATQRQQLIDTLNAAYDGAINDLGRAMTRIEELERKLVKAKARGGVR